MSGCTQWRYFKVTPKVFQALREKGKDQGVFIPGSPVGSFAVKSMGLKILFEYSWHRERGTLKLHCISRPAFVGCSTIKQLADQIIVSSGGQSE